jgi:phage tail sheath gpL-like
MRDWFRLLSSLAIGVSLGLSLIAMPHRDAFAQAQAPAAVSAAPSADADQIRQVTLTEKQIEGVLASQKEFDAIAEKLPETAPEQPDPKVTAQFEAVAKKYGFASYDEYNDVVDTISLVLGGFDPTTKQYVGADAVIKAQITAVQADQSIPADDKAQALEQLNDALKSPVPASQLKANIELVAKYYDKLNAEMQQGD